jgi:hypothetical protein
MCINTTWVVLDYKIILNLLCFLCPSMNVCTCIDLLTLLCRRGVLGRRVSFLLCASITHTLKHIYLRCGHWRLGLLHYACFNVLVSRHVH